jgi:pyruvate ferredoxin oxidoreductase beta subunit
MNVTREFFRNLKELPRDEVLAPGSPLCAGCGGLASLRLMLNVLGHDVIVVNAAGCLTLMAVYPFTPMRCSWLYTTMASAAAGAQGVRDALDVLIAKGRVPPDDNLKVLVVAGDGSSADMGLSSTSGAIHRNLDFYYLCYDNEAYGNTGFQMSSMSPFGSRTATSSARNVVGTVQQKKDLFDIWRAHKPPYVATISTADPIDLAEKVRRSMGIRGPKLFIAFAACPTGWGFDPSQSHAIAGLAIDTGIWPLKQAFHGEVHHTFVPRRRKLATDYLRAQRRFRHLFKPVAQTETLSKIEQQIEAYWAAVAAGEACDAKGA